MIFLNNFLGKSHYSSSEYLIFILNLPFLSLSKKDLGLNIKIKKIKNEKIEMTPGIIPIPRVIEITRTTLIQK